MPQPGTAACAVGAAFLALLLNGCAYVHTAPDRSRHVFGILYYAVLPPQDPAPAESIRTRTIGVSLTRGDVGTALSLGYSDIDFAYVRENTCVRWPLAGSLQRKNP